MIFYFRIPLPGNTCIFWWSSPHQPPLFFKSRIRPWIWDKNIDVSRLYSYVICLSMRDVLLCSHVQLKLCGREQRSGIKRTLAKTFCLVRRLPCAIQNVCFYQRYILFSVKSPTNPPFTCLNNLKEHIYQYMICCIISFILNIHEIFATGR